MNKAWEAITDNKYHNIVFAGSEIEAMIKGANIMNITADEIETVIRAPEFDRYISLGYVPPFNLVVDHGWWWECFWCEKIIHTDDDDIDIDGLIGAQGQLFCSRACFNEYLEKKSTRNKAFEAFKQEVVVYLEKIGGIQITDIRGGWPWKTFTAEISFPGSKYMNTIKREYDETEFSIWISNGDIDAWRKHTAK